MPLGDAVKKVAVMPYGEVKAVLRSHGVSIWLDQQPIVRKLLAEKISSGEIKDPTDESDVVVKK